MSDREGFAAPAATFLTTTRCLWADVQHKPIAKTDKSDEAHLLAAGIVIRTRLGLRWDCGEMWRRWRSRVRGHGRMAFAVVEEHCRLHKPTVAVAMASVSSRS